MILCEYVKDHPDLLRDRSLRMLRLLYEGFGYPLDRISTSVFYRHQDSGTSRVHYYTPMYKGKERKPPKCIYDRFMPETWAEYVYLGYVGHPVQGLIPMLLGNRDLQGVIVHRGCMYLSRDVLSEEGADDLLEEAAMYRSSGYMTLPNTAEMAFSAGMMGKEVVWKPGQAYLPAVCNLGPDLPDTLHANTERLEQMLLPLEDYHALPLSLVDQTDMIRQKAAMAYWACVAWSKMKHGPGDLGRIYDIYVDATHTVRIPAQTLSKRQEFSRHFQDVRENQPLKLWNVIAWEDEEHLRVLRYYFENRGFTTFVPPVQADLGGTVSRTWLLVNSDNTSLPRDSDLYQKALEDLKKARTRKDVVEEMDLWGYYPASAYSGILPYQVQHTRLDTDL